MLLKRAFLVSLLSSASSFPALAQDLNSFAVLGGSTVTNTGNSVITGNVGVSPGSAITGFPPGIVLDGTIYRGGAIPGQAQSDLAVLYTLLASRPATQNLTGQNLGNRTLGEGVYRVDTAALLNGPLVLDGAGDPTSVFIFNINDELTTGAASSVQLINGAQGSNVFFVVGSSATLGTTSAFSGRILALQSISLTNGASISCGAALARNGAVTLINNRIFIPDDTCIIPLAEGAFGDALDDDATENERAVAALLDAFIAAGGTLPLGFQFLAGALTPEELADALDALSGEAGTGTSSSGVQAMNSFLDLLGDLGYGEGSPYGDQGPPENSETPQTVRVLGYVDEKPTASEAFASYGAGNGLGSMNARRWRVWAAAFGGYRLADGDSSVGSHDLTSSSFGVATGFDYRIMPDTKIGFALAGGGTRFHLSDDLGSGESDMFQVALYGRKEFGAAYLAGAGAYAWHGVSTERTALGQEVSADFDAHNVAGQLEGGYAFGWFTPYAAVRGQVFYTPSYSEEGEDGPSIVALDYDENTTLAGRTELGARVYWEVPLNDTTRLGLRGRAAWAHGFSSDRSIDASFQALPGPGFTVTGADDAEDSLLLTAGAELGFADGFAVSGTFEGEIGENQEAYGGRARISYRW